MIVRACDVYDSRANEVAVLEYVSKLRDGSERLEHAYDDSSREAILQETHDMEKPDDLDDLSPTLTQQLVTARNSIDLWLANNIDKPIAASDAEKVLQFKTSMTENEKYEGEFTSLEAMQTLKIWSYTKQQKLLDQYISLLESFRSMQNIHNEKFAGSATIIKDAGEVVKVLASQLRESAQPLYGAFDFEIPEDSLSNFLRKDWQNWQKRISFRPRPTCTPPSSLKLSCLKTPR